MTVIEDADDAMTVIEDADDAMTVIEDPDDAMTAIEDADVAMTVIKDVDYVKIIPVLGALSPVFTERDSYKSNMTIDARFEVMLRLNEYCIAY